MLKPGRSCRTLAARGFAVAVGIGIGVAIGIGVRNDDYPMGLRIGI